MEFYEHTTAFDHMRRAGAWLGTHREFYNDLLIGVRAETRDPQEQFNAMSVLTECAWIDTGRPYFKLFPGAIGLLGSVGLQIPGRVLRFPFESFVIRFPKPNSVGLRSIMVAENPVRDDGKQLLMLFQDVDETVAVGMSGFPKTIPSLLYVGKDELIEDALLKLLENPSVAPNAPDELWHLATRLIVSVCFLATGGDKLIQPDVLSKDLAAYIEARRKQDEPKIKTIEERAVRRKGPGFNVGQHEVFRPLYGDSQHAEGEGGQELHFQHQRRAHFRLLPKGDVVFVRQCTVRPDLPPSPRSPAYAIR